MKMFKGGGTRKMMRQMEAVKGRGGLPGMWDPWAIGME
jgi:hypothetical protein